MSWALLIAILLNLFDALATWHGIGAGYIREVNPLWIWVIGHYGWAAFLIIKSVIFCSAITMIYMARKKQPKMAWYALAGAIGIYGLIAISHITFFIMQACGV